MFFIYCYKLFKSDYVAHSERYAVVCPFLVFNLYNFRLKDNFQKRDLLITRAVASYFLKLDYTIKTADAKL